MKQEWPWVLADERIRRIHRPESVSPVSTRGHSYGHIHEIFIELGAVLQYYVPIAATGARRLPCGWYQGEGANGDTGPPSETVSPP